VQERFAGKYQLLRHLAKGGMGEVLLASLHRQAGFAKLVVVKRILPHFAQDPDFVRMFIQEARISAALDHPNIVRVYDFGRAGDSFFLVMEYLHGDALLALLPKAVATPEGLPLEVTLHIVLGVCAGLHFAHEATSPDGASLGIVHRDISPANVFVTHSGEVKILDFGIAKAVSAGTVTRVGGRKGKVAYMSPEQCLGEPIDRRSDIFAIGILLYEMTTAKRLFRGNSEFEVMDMITSGKVPPPSERALDYPPALEAVVLKALARDPAERYATAQELHDALEQVAVELGLRPSAAALGRFVRQLTNDKRYPSLEPEAAGDDSPTLNFFASLNDVVTVGDIPVDPAAAPVWMAPPIVEAPDEPPPRPSGGRSRGVLVLVGAVALILLAVASLLMKSSTPAPVAATPEPPPAAAPPSPAPEPPAATPVAPPVVAATPTPPPATAPDASKPKTSTRKKTTKKRSR
jgi:serine/threonine protein kinase